MAHEYGSTTVVNLVALLNVISEDNCMKTKVGSCFILFQNDKQRKEATTKLVVLYN